MRGEIGICLLVLSAASPCRAQRTIVVRATGGEATSISAAIRLARRSGGDRILVSPGVYAESTIVVDRPVSIIGEPGAILDGARATHIMRIDADDVTVRGLGFRRVAVSHVEDRAAIRIGEVRGCRIEENRVDDAFFGIYLAGTSECVIARNELRAVARSEDVAGNGIHLWTARDISVIGNRVTGHRDGIYLEFARNARVTGNVATGNLRYGLHFMYSDDCLYERNEFRGNQAGVAVMYTRRVVMSENRFEDNVGASAYGLLLKEIYDSRLEGNTFARNTTGLLADGATRLIAVRNSFIGNGWALKLLSSTEGADFSGNVFASNSFDVATNSRSSANTLRGNYWDDYRGYDLDRDGNGDVPHRPVRLFSLIVERYEPALVLQRSPLVALLDGAERLLPSLTPETLVDATPLMRRPR